MIPEKCPKCGEETETGARFCGNCGQALAAEPADIASEPVVAPLEAPASIVAAPVSEAPAPAAVPAYALPDPIAEKRSSKATSALVLSIMAIPAVLLPYISLVLAIVAIVLAKQIRPELKSKGVTTATIIIAIFAILLVVAVSIYGFLTVSTAP